MTCRAHGGPGSWPEQLTQETPHKIEGLNPLGTADQTEREHGEIGDYSTPGSHSLAHLLTPMIAPPRFKTVVVSVDAGSHVGTLRLNRPSKSNAIDGDMWTEIPKAVRWLDDQAEVRVVVVTGAGKNFCAGIDVSSPESLTSQLGQATAVKCPGHKAEALFR